MSPPHYVPTSVDQACARGLYGFLRAQPARCHLIVASLPAEEGPAAAIATGWTRPSRRSSPRTANAGVIAGLPDAYGRGRIAGDYRRVALYAVIHLIEAKQAGLRSLDDADVSEAIVRDREVLSEQIRAPGELEQLAAAYGHDVSRPAATAKEAVQWLYFAYLAAVKEQNGAAMPLGRTVDLLPVSVIELHLVSETGLCRESLAW
ncbi:pyruvate formate lyase family protein [Nonomuraea rubra]|uniref:pyruvate formate lyase family protein n=1 Tax=Nonomuraea rubra TaxID=46180 RepID=UPI00340B667D